MPKELGGLISVAWRSAVIPAGPHVPPGAGIPLPQLAIKPERHQSAAAEGDSTPIPRITLLSTRKQPAFTQMGPRSHCAGRIIPPFKEPRPWKRARLSLLPAQEKPRPLLVNIYPGKIASDNRAGSFFSMTTKAGLRLSGWDRLNMRLLPWEAGIRLYWCVGLLLPPWNLQIATKPRVFVNTVKVSPKGRGAKSFCLIGGRDKVGQSYGKSHPG